MTKRSQVWIGLVGMGTALAVPWLGAAPVWAAAPPAAEATPPASPAAQAEPPPMTSARRVLLVPGDTLWGLAQQYQTSVALLQRANGLGNSTLIYAGDWLVIPGQVTVGPGSTLWQIATAAGVTVSSIMALNQLTGSVITPGEILYLPYPAEAVGGGPAQLDVAPATVLLELAHLVQAEAGNQPFLGMVAVAAVVLNRVKAPGFPKTVSGVIFQPGQFESVANGSYWQAPSAAAYQAAEEALKGVDPTDGALYYYNPALTSNAWMRSLPITVTIGQQVFCR